MPLKRDHLEDAIGRLTKAITLCARISENVIAAKETESEIEDLCEKAQEDILLYHDGDQEKYQPLFQAEDILFQLEMHKEPRAVVARQCNLAIDLIYEGLGELRPVSDPAQIEISFEGNL